MSEQTSEDFLMSEGGNGWQLKAFNSSEYFISLSNHGKFLELLK
jgi:hypothetical protein